ncbi:putative Domain (DUF4520) [Leishmania utingensis]|uniref:Domain (DUF4520) n=1 Tax=Leishmania utingensis TaxID=653362 RepID=A0AAW3A1B8_9TRYP
MLTPSSLEDFVVRAAAWDDGGVEFIFADSTILSFVDNMNTFVAVRSNPRPRQAQPAATQVTHNRQQQERRQWSPTTAAPAGDYVDSIDNSKDDDDENCELCFTAWTLSKNAAKVRAALHIFNSLSEQPRLLLPLLPSKASVPLQPSSLWRTNASSMTPADMMVGTCGVWQEPGPPIDTLLLERRADLFRRHVVLGSVREWMPAPETPPQKHSAGPSAAQGSSTTSGLCFIDSPAASSIILERAAQLKVGDGVSAHTAYTGDSTASSPKEVPVGTVLELWCALRRVRMTVAVHRETFTVRWPAPVTRPDGSRLPPSFHARDTEALHLSPSSPSWSSCVPYPGSASAPLLFAYIEQTFPVRDPPDAWRVMLQLALELEAELLEADKEARALNAASVSVSHAAARAVLAEHDGSVGGSSTWQGCLPEPHRWSGELNQHRNINRCRFSPLSASQASHLAAPRTARAVDAMRALHSPGAQLRWMYEANHSGAGRENPPAVYWCLRGTTVRTAINATRCSVASVTGTSTAAPLWGTEVVAWVAEDGSVVRTKLEGQGYTIKHHRLHLSSSCVATPAPVVYRLQAHDPATAVATADKRLPSRIAPLRCRLRVDPNSWSSSQGDRKGLTDAAAAAASAPRVALPVAIIDPQSLYCLSASSTDNLQNGDTTDPVTPACACSLLEALTTVLVSSERRVARCSDANFSAAGVAPSLASVGSAATCGRVANSETPDSVRCLRLGRYIASVVDVAIQLSQVNCAALRAADVSSTSTDKPRLAAYCCTEPSTASPSCWSPSAHGFSGNKGFHSVAPVSASNNASVVSVVYLTSRLEGIGTFTALTNGTIRVHFDDRTLLTLVPGVNEVDEAQLLATCVLRNTTRCRMRASQCYPGHAMHRYLAYALPFRRYVYWRAVHLCEPATHDGVCAGVSGGEREVAALQKQPQERQAQSRSTVLSDADECVIAHHGTSASLASIPAMATSTSLIEHQLLDESVCLLPSLRSCSLATSFGVLNDDEEHVATVLNKASWPAGASSGASYHQLPSEPTSSPHVCLPVSETMKPHGSLHDTGTVWGLVETERTMQAYCDSEDTEVAAQRARLQELLDRNEALSHATRALLRY